MSDSYITHDDEIQDNFTMLSNQLLRDDRLTLKARGLAAWLLSHKRGFRLSTDRIVQLHKEGKAAIRAALQELEEHGYLSRERLVDDLGRMTGMRYTIRQRPAWSDPQSDFPSTDNPPVENRTPYKKTTSKKITKKKTNPPGGAPRSTSPEGLSLDDPAPATHEEEPMPRRSPEPQLGLFEAERPAAAPKPPGAHTVAAAYVDAFRAHFSSEPTKGAVGRVARLAKEMMGTGTEVALLVEAATLLGATPYAALDVQVNKMRRPQQSGSRAMVPAVPHDADVWAEMAAESARRDAEAAQDPRWLAYQQGLSSEGVAS